MLPAHAARGTYQQSHENHGKLLCCRFMPQVEFISRLMGNCSKLCFYSRYMLHMAFISCLEKTTVNKLFNVIYGCAAKSCCTWSLWAVFWIMAIPLLWSSRATRGLGKPTMLNTVSLNSQCHFQGIERMVRLGSSRPISYLLISISRYSHTVYLGTAKDIEYSQIYQPSWGYCIVF